MKDRPIQFAFAFLALIAGAVLEEFLPHPLGVGFPVLLTLVQFLAARNSTAFMVVTSIAAGALEDAICSLPFLTCVSYFLIVAAFVRWSGLPRMAIVLTYPCNQIWLAAWTGGLGGRIFGRLLLSVPIGLLTAGVVVAGISWLSGKVAADEQE